MSKICGHLGCMTLIFCSNLWVIHVLGAAKDVSKTSASMCMISVLHQQMSIKSGKLFYADEMDSEMHAFRSKCILFKNQDRLKADSQLTVTAGGTKNVQKLLSSGLHETYFLFKIIGYSRVESCQKMCVNPEQTCA